MQISLASMTAAAPQWLRSRLAAVVKVAARIRLRRYARLVERSGFFDRNYYLSQNPDVAEAGVDALKHYLIRGAYEGRDPHPSFNTRYYLSQNPDVAKAGMNPLLHYVLYGAAEGRSADPSIDSSFGSPRQSPEVTRPRANPLAHFLAKLRMPAASRKLSEALVGTSALVSVIIPCFNYGMYLWDAVASVLAQTYPNIEVVIVDDGSTDRETLEVLDKIRNDRVRVIHQSNQGLAQARNNGAAAACGEYILFLDADDRLESHAVAVLLYALLRDPSAAYAYPAQRFFGDQDLIWTPQAFNAYDLLWANHPSVSSLIRRDVFNEAGGYRLEMLYGYEDWEFWIRLSSKNHFGVYVPAPVFEHRRHGITMTHTAHERKLFLHSQILSINHAWYLPERITSTKRAWRPLISVIIPFYNSPRYLQETLASLEGQTTQDFEIILVNDGSDDSESLRMLDELRKSGRVTVIDCEHHGLSATRNTGASLARADLIMFLDSDDLLDPGALEKLCWTIARHRDLAFVYSGVVHFGDIQGVCYDVFDPARLQRENFLAATCVMRRAIYLELGGNDPTMTRSWEDYDFWLRLVDHGYKGELFREPLFFYRRHGAGRSAQLVQAAAAGVETISQAVIARHVAHKGDAGLRPLASRTAQTQANETDVLLEEMEDALNANVPRTISREQYRRPNLPNMFCPRRWSGEKTTVLYLIPYFRFGGAEAFDLRIMSCLPKERYSIMLVACEQTDGPWYEEFKAAVDEIYSLERMAVDRNGREAFLRYLMIGKSVDIVLNRNTSYGYELADKWPLVCRQVRFVDLLHLHGFGEDWVRTSAPYHEKIDLRYVTSEDLPEYAARKYNLTPDRFHVLDYGLEPEELPDEPTCVARRHAIRVRWKIPGSAFVVGFIGRLTEQKDPIRWLSIAGEIARRRPGTVFLIVGGGELINQAKAVATNLGLSRDVVFTDYQRDAVNYCVAMDVLMLTSKYEGLPLVVLHALAQGTPVISSDVGGLRWCLTGHAGRILPPNESDGAYADAVVDIGRIHASDASARANCRERIEGRFVKDRMRLQLQDDLTSLTTALDRERRRRDYQLDLMSRPILG